MSNASSATLPLVIINGEPSKTLSIFDRAFQYGDGLFETIAILDGNPALLDKHLARLQKGLRILLFPALDLAALKAQIRHYSSQFQQAVLKLTVTRGESDRGYKQPDSPKPNIILSFAERDFQRSIDQMQGLTIRRCQTPAGINPLLAGIKHLNRLEQVLARSEWNNDAYAEGIMCDPDGHVIEATAANLFLWHNDCLFTPELNRSGVAGVVRELVMETADQLGIDCKVKNILIEECHHADALFLTNALNGIMPVARFESTAYANEKWPHELFKQVMQHVFA